MPTTAIAPCGPNDWDVATAAIRLGLSENSIRRAIYAGQLPHHRIGPAGKLIRIKPAEGYKWRGIEPPETAAA